MPLVFAIYIPLRGTVSHETILLFVPPQPIFGIRYRSRNSIFCDDNLCYPVPIVRGGGGNFLDFFFMYCIQHCFICRPSYFTVSEDDGIEPRTVPIVRTYFSLEYVTALRNIIWCALQRHNTETRNKYSQKRNCAASVPISTFMCL
jgi:hypothetical protein